VSPIQIDLGAGHRTAVVTVHSDQDESMLLQAQVLAWSQPDGVDALSDTSEVLVTPAVFTLPAHGQQVVRIALRSDPDREQERDFRLIVEEVPGAVQPNFTGLNIALRMSLPVFVLPAAKAAPAVAFSADWDTSARKLTVVATNSGGAHIQFRGLEARLDSNPDGSGWRNPVLKYVLPGSRMSWQWAVPPDTILPAQLYIQADSDQGPLSATVDTAASPAQP
jgi:fimbrial chaperone protein